MDSGFFICGTILWCEFVNPFMSFIVGGIQGHFVILICLNREDSRSGSQYTKGTSRK